MENNESLLGVHEANVIDYTVTEAKNGNPQVYVKFAFMVNGQRREKGWYGSFAGGAKDITLKSLIACGLKPQNFDKLGQLINGVQSGLLDLNKTVSIDIQQEPKDDGSMREVIRWVNDPEMAPGAKKIDEAKNSQYFGTMNFAQDLVRLAGEMGLPLNNGGQNQMGNPNQGQQNFNTMGQNQQQNGMNNQNQNTQQQNFNQGQQSGGGQNFNQGQQGNNGQGFNAPF